MRRILAFAVLISRFPIQSAVYMAFFATGLVFPLGILFTRMAGVAITASPTQPGT